MILVNTVENHETHKKELLECFERFKGYYDTKMPSQYVRKTGERILLENVHSDNHIHNIRKAGLDYFYESIIREIMPKIGEKLLLNKFGEFDWDIHHAWYQQYYEDGAHIWHTHPNCQFTNIYYVEMPNEDYKTEVLGVNGKLITFDAKEGDIITFPSWLQHRSKSNGKDRKTVISFNSSYGLL